MSKSSPLMTYLKDNTQPHKTVKGVSLQRIPKGHKIFIEGDRGDDAYVLKTGQVEISVMDGNRKLVLTRLTEQSVFGEMALILDAHLRTATATALEDCHVIRIPKKAFDAYMRSAPSVISKCLVVIATRLNELTDKASHAGPDLFESTAQVLHLMQVHHWNNLLYDKTVAALATLTAQTDDQVGEVLEMMTAMNLIKITRSKKDHKRIHIIGRTKFLENALKIKTLLKQYQEPDLKATLPREPPVSD